ncbi:alpha/beta fold hydrolase [Mycobacterium sp. CVI_P3]|uniref:Alpha/beta fold hydrolase n=1 Tax=Mycobacterium pinniadriaticum TaxID=2994102 RepID=A0ABT3S8Q5_9MYCO|nr:alpha/beta fold hydrolase [Mycobacterium pinniadriaticum]MCX2929462.1 alpha/beta fold hydrolase [Mycobacterium pinniadriaticum]MCX2935886.1 alpha/beta fold hydrolase [Mycobacterium pinniadriaticum]
MIAASAALMALAALSVAWLVWWAKREVRPAEPAEGSVLRFPGGDLHVHEQGRKHLQTVVLLHGFGGSMRWWKACADQLSGRFHVIRVDLPGHGASEKHRGDYSIDAAATLVGAALDQMRVDRAWIVGQSMGGFVAVTLAQMRSSLVAGLVLVDVPLELRHQNLNRLGRLAFTPCFGILLRTFATRRLLARGLRPLFSPGYHIPDTFIGDLRRMTWSSFKGCDEALDMFLLSEPTPETRVRALSMPVRVIWGTNDQLFPIVAAAPYRQMSNIAVHEIRDCGHSPMVEAPYETTIAIAECISPITLNSDTSSAPQP